MLGGSGKKLKRTKGRYARYKDPTANPATSAYMMTSNYYGFCLDNNHNNKSNNGTSRPHFSRETCNRDEASTTWILVAGQITNIIIFVEANVKKKRKRKTRLN